MGDDVCKFIGVVMALALGLVLGLTAALIWSGVVGLVYGFLAFLLGLKIFLGGGNE